VRDLAHVVEHAAEALEDLRGGRLLVTGGSGFIGRWMLETFLHANASLALDARCVIVTRDLATMASSARHVVDHPSVEVIEADVRALPKWAGSCSHVLHLATESGSSVTPAASFDTAVRGTQQVLSTALASGAQRFLYTSSGAVYGRQPPDLTHVPETYQGAPDPLDPETGYGQGKRAAEYLCVAAAEGGPMVVTIARCFAFVGPLLPLDRNFAIGNFIRDVLEGRAISVAGDGTPKRSYLYAADLAIWLWTILARGTPGTAYNVGSESDLSISELAALVAATISPGTPVRIALDADGHEAASRYVPSIRRASVELGLRERIPLGEAIRRTAEWYVP
jgi:nucleoside-diphosphate-sugar epimerase